MSLEALEALVDETVAAQNAEKDLSTKTLVELDEMEDELLDDERMLECDLLSQVSFMLFTRCHT